MNTVIKHHNIDITDESETSQLQLLSYMRKNEMKLSSWKYKICKLIKVLHYIIWFFPVLFDFSDTKAKNSEYEVERQCY